MKISTGLEPTVDRSGPGLMSIVRFEKVTRHPTTRDIRAVLTSTTSVVIEERVCTVSLPMDADLGGEEHWQKMVRLDGIPDDATIVETADDQRRVIVRRASWWEVTL